MDNFREEKLQIANKYKTCKIPNCQGNTNQVCEFEKESLKLDNIKHYCNCYKNWVWLAKFKMQLHCKLHSQRLPKQITGDVHPKRHIRDPSPLATVKTALTASVH